MKTLASYPFFFLCCGLAWSELKTVRRCLREKVIIFPEQATKNYVQLHANDTMDFPGITVCLRFYTDESSKNQSLFSLATPSEANDFTISLSPINLYKLQVHGTSSEFNGLPFKLNRWNSVCATWNSVSGFAQVFVDEVPSVQKAVAVKNAFKGDSKVVLGQSHKSYANVDFMQDLAFTGFITDVHVYKEVLTPRLIKNFMEAKIKFKLGDYINWRNLKHTVAGSASVEPRQHVTFYTNQEEN
ncbi:amyloid P component, serum [Triplophysa rosa]|uniref:amyloid P component, serum n=1 Tax=Triplophysa rosa TaxID=992332 RepID=UPI002545CBCB|nr:amyloid P component, serum [Triplophysa rosa]